MTWRSKRVLSGCLVSALMAYPVKKTCNKLCLDGHLFLDFNLNLLDFILNIHGYDISNWL